MIGRETYFDSLTSASHKAVRNMKSSLYCAGSGTYRERQREILVGDLCELSMAVEAASKNTKEMVENEK
jgi:hypothetical protein